MNDLDNATVVASKEQGESGLCAECGAKSAPARVPDQFIYSLGRLDARFPTIGIEREFEQRERGLSAQAADKKDHSQARGERLNRVLIANLHLARRLCYVLSVGSMPAYIVAPTGADVLAAMIDAIRAAGKPDQWVLLVGRRVGNSSPSTCGGLLAPIVACDQLYSFSFVDLLKNLSSRAEPALKSLKMKPDQFAELCREVFERVVQSTENIGGTDAHRALNFALVQHPGLFISAVQRMESSVLDRIETRPMHGPEARRQVALILTFLDRATGVPERLFCVIDVSEEWPFLADGADGSRAPLGLLPFVENQLVGIV
jgi:hypothetical protein